MLRSNELQYPMQTQGKYIEGSDSATMLDTDVPCVEECAFFVDAEGAFLEHLSPQRLCRVDQGLRDALRALALRTGGATALVSGRSIATLDANFAPLYLPTAGLHGFERRTAGCRYARRALPSGLALGRARRWLAQIAHGDSRLELEDRRFALALHYRQAPDLEELIVHMVQAIADAMGGGFEVQRGQFVVEIHPGRVSKAHAVSEFMRELPFIGKRPIFVGHDLSNESAFKWVNEAGGLSVGVNVSPSSSARKRLSSIDEARSWLGKTMARENAPREDARGLNVAIWATGVSPNSARGPV
jgi:trehalose 6-phosphate phosphatase